jgi:hypothetical protein
MDPVSLTASIVAILGFTAQVGSAINSFVTEYRATDSELKALAKEVDALRAVLNSLWSTYQESSLAIPQPGLGETNMLPCGQEDLLAIEHRQTDKALEIVLDGLDESLKQLLEIVRKSTERMAKGRMYKIYVQALWKRTATGIERVSIRITIMVLKFRFAIYWLVIKRPYRFYFMPKLCKILLPVGSFH